MKFDIKEVMDINILISGKKIKEKLLNYYIFATGSYKFS